MVKYQMSLRLRRHRGLPACMAEKGGGVDFLSKLPHQRQLVFPLPFGPLNFKVTREQGWWGDEADISPPRPLMEESLKNPPYLPCCCCFAE